MTDRVVMCSGGIGSWATGRRVFDNHTGPDDTLHLLFADTMMEDEDLYRFLDDVADDLGTPITRVADGRTPWDVFRDVRFLGNSRIDPCSRILKRELLRDYIDNRFDPATTVVYLGIDWSEEHRFTKAEKFWTPWTMAAPLCDPPLRMKQEFLDDVTERGIRAPRLYDMGFAHNNCGGFCVKAGLASFALLLREMPERYAYHEQKERELQEYLGKPVTILRDRRIASRKAAWDGVGEMPTGVPMSMQEFRERLQAEEPDVYDPLDIGGCDCFSPTSEDISEDDDGIYDNL